MTNDISEERAGAIEADELPIATILPGAVKPWPPWKTKAGMLRSRVYKNEIAPLFTPEGQERLVQEILERIMPTYSADITKRAAMKEDQPPSEKPIRGPIVVQRSTEDVKKFWMTKLATLNTERMALHVRLAQVENERNATTQMLDQLRTNALPNGYNPEAA